MTLFNLSVDQSDADPVVDSSTFSDLRPVLGLNVVRRHINAVQRRRCQLPIDHGHRNKWNIKIFDKA